MEVTAKLEFTRPCLGSIRREDCDLLQRDRDGNVIFLTSWWRGAMGEAARAINRYHRHVEQIYPKLQIDGPVKKIKRHYGKGPNDWKWHECFDEGAVITVRFAIPNKMKIGQFTELLEATGDYIGVSPYAWRKGYGRFRVLEVVKVSGRRS